MFPLPFHRVSSDALRVRCYNCKLLRVNKISKSFRSHYSTLTYCLLDNNECYDCLEGRLSELFSAVGLLSGFNGYTIYDSLCFRSGMFFWVVILCLGFYCTPKPLKIILNFRTLIFSLTSWKNLTTFLQNWGFCLTLDWSNRTLVTLGEI